MPPSKDDLLTRIKKELSKKNEVQQLTGELQSMIKGVKTPEELSTKIKNLIQENESLKKDLELLNQILNNNNQDEDDDGEINKPSLVDHLLPQKQIEKIKKRDNKQICTDENKSKITTRARLVVDQNAIYQEFADNVVSLLPTSDQNNQKKNKKSQKSTKRKENRRNFKRIQN